MGLRHAVITSVNRDDQQDGGAGVVRGLHPRDPRARPRLRGRGADPGLQGRLGGPADVVLDAPSGHPQPQHRDGAAPLPARCGPGARFERSLELLRALEGRRASPPRAASWSAWAKSGTRSCETIRGHPRRGHRHPDRRPVPAAQRRSTCRVVRYYTPEEFAEHQARSRCGLGYRHVESGPLVRSSYHADEQVPTRRRSGPRRPLSGAAQAAASMRARPTSTTSARRALDLVRGGAAAQREPQRTPARAPARRPMARSTCDGSTAPAAQAAPVETATPARSSAISRLSASTPSNETLVGVGTRGRRRCAARPAIASSAPPGGRAAPSCGPPSAASSSRASAAARPKPDDAGHVLGARAAVALLRAAAQQRRIRVSAPDEERAHALRPVDLVGGEREQVHVERAHVDAGSCPRPARRRSARARRFARASAHDLRHRLDRRRVSLLASITATQRRALVEPRREVVEVDAAVRRRRAPARPASPPRRAPSRCCSTAWCSMADTRPCAAARGAAARPGRAAPCCPPRVPLPREARSRPALAPSSAATSAARLVERRARPLAEPVQARRVAEGVAQHGGMAVEHARVERRGGVVIEVDALHAMTAAC